MNKVPRIVTVVVPVASTLVDSSILVVEEGAEYVIEEVIHDHSVAGSDAGAVTCDVTKCTGTQAPSAGTSVLASTFNLKSTANTPVSKTAANAGLAALPTRTVKEGERLAINVTGTLTALAGFVLHVVLRQTRAGTNR